VPGNLNNNYTYTYDKLNRLTSGTSADNNNETGITYDLMGNITALNRYQANTLIDQLGYTYNSTNQVQSIVDGSGSNTGLNSGTMSYSYDANGNLLNNTNTAVTTQNKSFTYNLLNLPIVATVATGTATYTYDATGNNLRKVDVLSGTTTATDYVNGIQYNTTSGTTSLSFIQTEEGKAVVNGAGYDYTYYLGDNLGNTRITFGTKTGAAVLYQQDDYYPFGLEINRSVLSPKNEYLYNRKELQEELVLYDYNRRFYDPVGIHWNMIDPLAEKDRRWSPYVYGFDNAIRFEDPDGMQPCNPCDVPGQACGNCNVPIVIGGQTKTIEDLIILQLLLK
jgi:RHS repeat-associated protein